MYNLAMILFEEELREREDAREANDLKKIEEELGDILFEIANLAWLLPDPIYKDFTTLRLIR